MNYKEARQYITEKEGLGSVFGLDSIRELLRRLGNHDFGRNFLQKFRSFLCWFSVSCFLP